MKFTNTLLLALAVNEATAFAPQSPAFVRPASELFMSEEPKGGLVPIKEETVEFTAGMIGGAAGFIIGGPVVAALGAAAANYVSKGESEAGTIVSAVSKTAIEVYNYLTTLDSKYELLTKAQASLEKALDKLKSQDSVDPAAIKKVEDALSQTKAKITEINDEYDLVGSGVTALGVIGDLVEKTVKKVGELNEEYKLTDKAKDALTSAIAKAKEATV